MAPYIMSPDVDLAYQIPLGSLRGVLSFPFHTYAFAAFYLIHLTLGIKLSLKKWLLHYQPYFIAAFAGLFVADSCHLILDFLSSYRIKKL
ncbi:MAG: hypothetical protein AB7F31_04080 [Parachlamydiales bacterium]